MNFEMKEYTKYILMICVFIIAILLIINKAKQVENICIENYENYIEAKCECESNVGFDPNNLDIDSLKRWADNVS